MRVTFSLLLAGTIAAQAMAQTAPPGWKLPMKAAQIKPADRTAIMRAAGYKLGRGGWVLSDCPAAGSISDDVFDKGAGGAIRDLNGDGWPDVIVTSGGIECYGNTGQGFQIVTLTPTGWKLLINDSGIPVFYPRAGSAWPDIEIGGPGTCFPRVRWTGTDYSGDAGESSENQSCGRGIVGASATSRAQPGGGGGPPVASTSDAPRWTVQTTRNGLPFANIAKASQTVTSMSVFCGTQDITLIAILPAMTAPNLQILFAGDAGSETIALQKDPASNAYLARVTNTALLDLLAGKSAQVQLMINGRDGGNLTLAGSSAALKGALAKCWSSAAALDKPAAPMPGGLPVPAGYYAIDGPCTGDRNNYNVITPSYLREIDGDTPIGPVRNLGGNRWVLVKGRVITVIDAKSFTMDGNKWTWCEPLC